MVLFAACCACVPTWLYAQSSATQSAISSHTIESEYQAVPTKIHLLKPSKTMESPDGSRRIVFVLPVEAQDGHRYGNGLREIEKLNLHNKHNVVCVAPTFSQLPWYADHPTDPKVRQESHLIRAVLPFVDKQLKLANNQPRRFLLGFSKSGWGAWSLLLRNPKLFERAAAWDAPLNMDRYGHFGSGPIFGTQENFLKYHVPGLIRQQAGELRKSNRLVLTGYGGFREHHEAINREMTKLKIRYEYRDGPRRKHHWDSGWLPEAFELLLE